MKSFKLGLRTEIILNMTVLMLFMIICVGLLVGDISRKDIYLKKTEGNIALIKALTNFLAPIISFNPDLKNRITKGKEIEQVVNTFFGDNSRVELIIADNKGRFFYGHDDSGTKKTIRDDNFAKLIELKTSFTLYQDDTANKDAVKKLAIYHPIMSDNKAIGGVVARFSMREERTYAARSQALIYLFVLLISIIFVSFGSFLLSRVIVTPITKLVRATHKIASGNLDVKVERFPATEIDSLAQAFNKMTESLSESNQNINEHVNSLETVNAKLKLAKDEVLRSAKLASVGRLAAGVAHEIGNPLGSIVGYLEILKDDPETDINDYIARIDKECHRIDAIVRELLDFSRTRKSEIKEININSVIIETCDALFHRTLFADIFCKMKLAEQLPKVNLDPALIQQVITNLIINSADAMEGGRGEIQISTAATTYKESMFASNKLTPGDKLLRLSISDSGTGILPDELDKIFDPFYTTKDPGKGTGLGLAISLRIIESFDGAITVENGKYGGTTFNIFLPVNYLGEN